MAEDGVTKMAEGDESDPVVPDETEDIFDVQISPGFETIDDTGLKTWSKGFAKWMKDQGAKVKPLSVDKVTVHAPASAGDEGAKQDEDGTFYVNQDWYDATFEWEFPNSPPVPVRYQNRDELEAKRGAMRESYARRYENSTALAGTDELDSGRAAVTTAGDTAKGTVKSVETAEKAAESTPKGKTRSARAAKTPRQPAAAAQATKSTGTLTKSGDKSTKKS